MSKQIYTSKRVTKTTEIFKNPSSSTKWRVQTTSANKSTIDSNKKYNQNYRRIKYKKLDLNHCTCKDKLLMTTASENMNSLNTTFSYNSYQAQLTDSDSKEKIKTKKTKKGVGELIWNKESYVQVMERLQYLAAEPPKLRVQFPNDLMITRTIIPIKILLPIPDNYIQSQDHFEIISKEKPKKEKPVVEKPVEEKPKPLKRENHSFDINANKRTWNGPIQPVKTNKLILEQEKTQNWNDSVQKENQENIQYKKDIKVKEEIKEEKKEEKKIIPYSLTSVAKITFSGSGIKPKKWNPIPVSEKIMTIINSSELSSSSSEESIIINDDYNANNEVQLRSIIVNVLRMREIEDDDTSESYDVFQNIVYKKVEFYNEIEKSLNEITDENANRDEYYEIAFNSNDKAFNGRVRIKKELKDIENEQKYLNDQNAQ